MYKKMLVPLDGSELAEVVLPYAREVARRFDLELALLHVCEPHNSEGQFMCQAYLDRTIEIAGLPGTAGEAPPVKVRGEVTSGHPAEEILGHAERNGVDLILMATHGRSGLRRWVLGNVADKVLRASSVPVWLVRAGKPRETASREAAVRTMLVPLDGSKYAEAVLPHVRALAGRKDGETTSVVLLRVFEEPFATADYPEPDWKEHVERMIGRFKEEAEKYIQGVRSDLAAEGLKVTGEVLMGNPAESIIDYAQRHRPDLIVMATHGASGLSRWEYGSIADKVLRGADTPIFMVHPH
jgi:nucleotide-binding universal stress UspA family protein